MIIGEEQDYFIYGCITTLFVEGILSMIYGYWYETDCCDCIKVRFSSNNTNNINNINNRTLLTENDSEFDNTFPNIPTANSPTESYIDL